MECSTLSQTSIFPSPRTQRTLRRGEGRSTEAGEEWHEAVSSGHDTRTHCSCSHPHKTCSKSGFSTPFHGTRNSPWGSTPNWLVTVNGGWRTVVTFFSGVVTDKLPTLPWTTSYSCSCNPNLTLWVTCTQKTWKCVCVCGTCWEESFQQGRMRKGNRLKGTEIHCMHVWNCQWIEKVTTRRPSSVLTGCHLHWDFCFGAVEVSLRWRREVRLKHTHCSHAGSVHGIHGRHSAYWMPMQPLWCQPPLGNQKVR